MPYGTVTLLSVPASFRTQEDVIFNAKDDIASQYVIGTINKVKVRHDMRYTLELPNTESVNVFLANMIRIEYVKGDGTSYSPKKISFYWVVNCRTISGQLSNIAMDLEFAPVPSMLAPSDSITGVFDRTQTRIDTIIDNPKKQGLEEIIANGANIPRLPLIYGKQTVFVQWTAKDKMVVDNTMTDDHAAAPPSAKVSDSLTKYGCFCYVSMDPDDRVYAQPAELQNVSNEEVYPSLIDIISDIDTATKSNALFLTASSIVDISVSYRSPYNYHEASSYMYGHNTITLDAGNSYHRTGAMVRGNTVVVNGTTLQRVYYALEAPAHAGVTNPVNGHTEEFRVLQSSAFDEEKSVTYQPEVVNDEGLTIGVLPWGPVGQSGSVKWYRYEVKTISDYTGITSYIYAVDEKSATPPYPVLKDNQSFRVKIPEGKLPWVGSAWLEYMASAMDTDRANMNLAVENAKAEMIQNAAFSIGGGIITGGIAGGGLGLISGGLGVASNVLSTQRAIETMKAQQELKEQQIQMQSGNAYASSYGLSYLLSPSKARIRIKGIRFEGMTMLSNSLAANTDYLAMRKQYGYAACGIKTVTLGEGFIQGKLTADNWTGEFGLKFDVLNANLINGTKIKIIGSDTP